MAEENKKIITFLRHAKSTWSYDGIQDQDRPLKKRGILNAFYVANHWLHIFNKPDLIITSPAVRAFHTAVIFSEVFKVSTENIKVNRDLYRTSIEAVWSVIEGVDDKMNHILLVGHNPLWDEMIAELFKEELSSITTSGLASFEFKGKSWSDIRKAENKMIYFGRPPLNFDQKNDIN